MFLEKYVNSKTKILCVHILCGHEYRVRPSGFLQGSRCPMCSSSASKSRKTNREFTKEVYDLVGDEYRFLDEYKNNRTKILCIHKFCGHKYKVTPNKFLMGRRCPECDKYKKKTNKGFVKEVYDLVGDEYEFLEKYIGVKEKILCKHSLCGHEYRVEPDSFIQGNRCPACSSNARKTNEAFVEEIYELVGDEYIFLETYVGAQISILCRHNLCGHEWRVQPHNFITNGNRCPMCVWNARRTNEAFIEEVHGLAGSEYEFLEEYVSAKTEILCRHISCGHEWRLRPDHFLRGRRCPVCTSSKGEREVKRFLKGKNISFKREYSFPDLVGFGGGLLRFDFVIFQNDKLISLIEYDGEFHFKKFYEEQNFEEIQIHDERKNQYCKDNNIPLLRIPYWEFDNIEKILEEFIGLADMRSDIF